jgi:hypothetical protein
MSALICQRQKPKALGLKFGLDLRGISSIKALRLRDIALSEVVLLPLKLKQGPGHSITALAWASAASAR